MGEYRVPMPDQKFLSLHPFTDPDFPGIHYVLIRVREAQAVHWRTLKRSADVPWPQLMREAERMAIERFPGLLTMQLVLPMGDSGHVLPASPDAPG
jgi:hypothetical protein